MIGPHAEPGEVLRCLPGSHLVIAQIGSSDCLRAIRQLDLSQLAIAVDPGLRIACPTPWRFLTKSVSCHPRSPACSASISPCACCSSPAGSNGRSHAIGQRRCFAADRRLTTPGITTHPPRQAFGADVGLTGRISESVAVTGVAHWVAGSGDGGAEPGANGVIDINPLRAGGGQRDVTGSVTMKVETF